MSGTFIYMSHTYILYMSGTFPPVLNNKYTGEQNSSVVKRQSAPEPPSGPVTHDILQSSILCSFTTNTHTLQLHIDITHGHTFKIYTNLTITVILTRF